MKWLASLILKMLGWKILYIPPEHPHGIVICYPHTSNWDFLYGMLWKFTTGFKVKWVAKDSLFIFPFGGLMRMLGGIGISRAGGQDNVTALSNAMLNQHQCWLAIAPEGTRNYKPYIKSGYYHIARVANVPVAIGVIDYGKKEVGIKAYRYTQETFAQELMQLKQDFNGVKAYDPKKVGDLKMRVSSDDIWK